MPGISLGVNVDHVATLREARGTRYPDPLHAALLAEQAGADSITVHLREDRRHIQERDVLILLERLTVPLNLEMALTPETIEFAKRNQPAYCCIVPEKRLERTTEGGLDVLANQVALRSCCARLREVPIRVSLFIEADAQQIKAAHEVGAAAVEIHTGHYADSTTEKEKQHELRRITEAARLASDMGMTLHAGHGLHYQNVSPILALPSLTEVNIGHSIIARALFTGMSEAVKEMKVLLTKASV